jgi:hypothetical protein
VIVAQPTAEKTLTWQIKPHQISKPAQVVDDVVFDDLSHNLITLSNMPEDWSSYATVKAYKNGVEFDDVTAAYGVGTYTLVFTLIDSDSCEWVDSKGRSESLPYTIYCDIVPKVLVVEGWYSKPGKPQFTEVVADKYYELVYTNEAGDVVDVSEATSTYNKTFTVTVKAASSMGDNVEVTAVDGVSLHEDFVCFDTLQSKPTKLTKPVITQTEIEYTGFDIDILDYLSNYKADLMNVAGDLSVIVVGDNYTIYVSILGSVNATWSDDTTDTLVLTYSIVKAKISPEFEQGQRIPSLAEGGSLVEYKYYDEKGREVDEEDLVQGVQYYIVGKIKDEYTDSYGFGDNGASETERVAFKVTPPVAVAIPTIDKYSYEFTSNALTFKLKGVDSAYVEYNASELTQTNANTYYVTVRIKSGEYAVWDDEEGGTDERQIEFVITKKTIAVDWDMTTSLPFLNTHGAVPSTGLSYKFYDSDGNQVGNNALKNGEKYTIKGILADEYAVNYAFEDTASSISSGQIFTYISSDQTASANGGQTTPANDDQTTPANGDQTTPANGDQTTPANGDQTTPANGDQTTPANGDQTTPASNNGSGNNSSNGDSNGDSNGGSNGGSSTDTNGGSSTDTNGGSNGGLNGGSNGSSSVDSNGGSSADTNGGSSSISTGGSSESGLSIPSDFPLWQVAVCCLAIVVGFVAYVKAGANNTVARRLKRKNKKM